MKGLTAAFFASASEFECILQFFTGFSELFSRVGGGIQQFFTGISGGVDQLFTGISGGVDELFPGIDDQFSGIGNSGTGILQLQSQIVQLEYQRFSGGGKIQLRTGIDQWNRYRDADPVIVDGGIAVADIDLPDGNIFPPGGRFL